jgi:hypothetical protein
MDNKTQFFFLQIINQSNESDNKTIAIIIECSDLATFELNKVYIGLDIMVDDFF